MCEKRRSFTRLSQQPTTTRVHTRTPCTHTRTPCTETHTQKYTRAHAPPSKCFSMIATLAPIPAQPAAVTRPEERRGPCSLIFTHTHAYTHTHIHTYARTHACCSCSYNDHVVSACGLRVDPLWRVHVVQE